MIRELSPLATAAAGAKGLWFDNAEMLHFGCGLVQHDNFIPQTPQESASQQPVARKQQPEALFRAREGLNYPKSAVEVPAERVVPDTGTAAHLF